jgi:serine/threonine-protein kinase
MQTGDELEVTVSLGEPKALVPTDLVGMALDAAELRLQAELLVLGEVTRVFDEEAPIDQVLEILEPLPELERGSAVALLVSDGPAPRPVPEGLVGLSEADAITVIEAARLVATRVEEFSDDVELGLVIAVTPPPGTELAVGSPVEIVVSLGREPVIVPDVEGLGIDEAQTILEDAGLVVIEIEGPPGRPVLTTDPPSGTELFAGDEVVIFTVGAGNGNGN